MKLLFATQNKNKLLEISRLIGEHHQLISLYDLGFNQELPETHETLEENALEKANYIFKMFHIDCFAEDSGLEVNALNGKPGVYSARYGGPEKDDDKNIDKILDEMASQSDRSARFRTVIALNIGGKEFLYEGIVNGTITKERRGLGGFGYDPIFVPEGYDKTFAELGLAVKNVISHRAIAFGKMKEFLSSEFISQ